LDATGDVYVVGETTSTDFASKSSTTSGPGTSGGAQGNSGGGTDAFVAQISWDLAATAPACATPGLVSCDCVCVDLRSDPKNCGSCGNVCPAEKSSCCAGTCIDLQDDPTNCGTCGTACGSNQSCCGGQCGEQGCPPGCPFLRVID